MKSIQEKLLERAQRQLTLTTSNSLITHQRRAFCCVRIPESRKKETVDLDILTTSRNGNRKMVPTIKMGSGIKKWKQ